MILLNGYSGDSVFSIDISSIFDSTSNNAWTFITDEDNGMFKPDGAEDISYFYQTSIQLDDQKIYGIPILYKNISNVWYSNIQSLLQFDLVSNTYAAFDEYSVSLSTRAQYPCVTGSVTNQKIYVIGGHKVCIFIIYIEYIQLIDNMQ